jgi:hypothetical protein
MKVKAKIESVRKVEQMSKATEYEILSQQRKCKKLVSK